MNIDRESAPPDAPTVVLMIALLVGVVGLVANAAGDSPLETVATEDPFEALPPQRVAAVADLRDTIDADVPTGPVVPAERGSSSAR